MKKYFEYFARKRGLRHVTIFILILLGGAIFLGVLSAREMRSIISEDFNNQQLALSKHAAGILSQTFTSIKRELLTLSLSPSIQYVEAVSWANRMKISLSSVGENGVFDIMLINAEGTQSYCMDYNGAIFTQAKSYGDEKFFQWCKNPENRNNVYMTGVAPGVARDSEPSLTMKLAAPVYQISSDEAHPVPPQDFSGVLVFVLDAGFLASKLVGPIRSGKTGYAWVIDDGGNFLYHLEREFIGQNAFEARRVRNPHIAFSKINAIQKDKMLKGKAGTSWYISGWHRGLSGTMKKLIAYAPVHLGVANTTQKWSVAVVAPISEVEDAVHSVYVRQSLIQGAFTAAVVIILVFLIANERAWLKTLEEEVEQKTEDLARYAKELSRSEERYRSLVESADDMIYSIDENCNILSVNQYCTQLTEKEARELVGSNIMDHVEHEEPQTCASVIAKVVETGGAFSREERVKIGDREFWLDTKYKSVGADQNGGNAVLVISRDITEHKMMEAQLFHTEKLASLGSLSAGVAHEINNPIAVILGFSEILQDKFPDGTKEKEIVKTIERQAENCKRIVENLLTFARIPEKLATQTDIVTDLQKVVNVVMNTLVTKKVDLRTDIEEDLPPVKGDGPQLEQVFLNIVNNAVSAMDGGGLLTISAHRSNGIVNINFTDTGHGIPSENMAKIFEPFFTSKKVGEGTGLGLSVSYGIVKKFGGDIRVTSQTMAEGKDSGTTFIISLPVANAGNGDRTGPEIGSPRTANHKGEDHA
ncbi:MAG: ATP-binding protein [Thermodesulfobacteriota bacterium]|nr:ATP-binding protein [Thermodesulfobacteriota bacterium]